MTGPPADAIDAAAEAITALARHDAAAARIAVSSAVAHDPSGVLARLADAVQLAASALEHDDGIPAAIWDQLADAAGPGSLRDLVESSRS